MATITVPGEEPVEYEPTARETTTRRDGFRRSDFELEDMGGIYFLRPQTDEAVAWANEHVGSENGYQPHWPTVLVEHRYLEDIVEGARADGLTVRERKGR